MVPRRLLPAALSLVVGLVVGACGASASGGTPDPSATIGPAATPSSTALASPSVSPPASARPAAPTAAPAATPPAAAPSGVTGPPPALDLEVVATGLDGPLDVAVRPGDPASVLVAEQAGRVRVVRDGSLVDEPFLDIAGAVTAGGEQGLLGVAMHPDPTDGRVYVYYTALDGDQVVSVFQTDPDDPDRALPDSERIVLEMADRYGNHNGGALVFGPDGYLYVATGDGGGGGDPLGSGRSLDTLLAKVLRLDVDVPGDADPPYAIPRDNPFVGQEDRRPEIWLTGLRNPWRMHFDPTTGDLWIGDVGQGAWEEIDRAPAGEGGIDFGWNITEGFHCYRAESCDDTGLTPPVAEYGHDEGCSVTGGAVYRGTAQPALSGWYVLSDYCSGRFWVLDPGADGRQEPTAVLDSGRNISAIAYGPDGELLATDLSSGELLRVVVAGG